MPQNDVALRILDAADVLMANEGVQNLSTHKIAKAAGVSVGTIYLHFKDKDDLLQRLVLYLFHQFQQAMEKGFDDALPLFEQYRQFWYSIWQFMQTNPDVVLNMSQYEALPQFQQLILECNNDELVVWHRFIKKGQAQNVIAALPPYVLFSMSLKVIWHLKYLELISHAPYSDAMLEEVILRTWKAITL